MAGEERLLEALKMQEGMEDTDMEEDTEDSEEEQVQQFDYSDRNPQLKSQIYNPIYMFIIHF